MPLQANFFKSPNNDHHRLHMNPITMHPNDLVLHLILLLHVHEDYEEFKHSDSRG